MRVYIKEIGQYLKQVMKIRKVNASTISKALNIAPTSISDILNDKAAPSYFSKLERIADFLNINEITIVFKKSATISINEDSTDYNLDFINIKNVSPNVRALIYKLIEEDKISRNRNDC